MVQWVKNPTATAQVEGSIPGQLQQIQGSGTAAAGPCPRNSICRGRTKRKKEKEILEELGSPRGLGPTTRSTLVYSVSTDRPRDREQSCHDKKERQIARLQLTPQPGLWMYKIYTSKSLLNWELKEISPENDSDGLLRSRTQSYRTSVRSNIVFEVGP